MKNALIPALGNTASKTADAQRESLRGCRREPEQAARARFDGRDFSIEFRGRLHGHVRRSSARKVARIQRGYQMIGTRYDIAAGFSYSSDQLNASGVDPGRGRSSGAQCRARIPRWRRLLGRLQAPLLTIHTTGDDFVPLEPRTGLSACRATPPATEICWCSARSGDPTTASSPRLSASQAWDDSRATGSSAGNKPDGDDVLSFDPTTLGGCAGPIPLLPRRSGVDSDGSDTAVRQATAAAAAGPYEGYPAECYDLGLGGVRCRCGALSGVRPCAARERVLELGCGTGRVSCRLAEAGLGVAGLDRSLDMLRQAKACACRAGAERPRDWMCADMTAVPLARPL